MDTSAVTPLLVADDHQMIIDGIRSMLAAESRYPIHATARDGQEAWSVIEQAPQACSILVTDISMPVMTGTELCRRVKDHYPHIKVLILSMYHSTTVVREAMQAEADGYILKNAGKEEFLTALHRIRENSTYFSQDILPLIYQQYQQEKKQDSAAAMLSAREREVLALIVKEMTSEEIARQLFISKKTVDTHRAHLLEKSQSRSTIGLVKFAIKYGLADL